MSRSTTKDPEALLMAFANMLNDFYGSEQTEDPTRPIHEPPISQQAGLKFDSAAEDTQADMQPIPADKPFAGPGPWDAYDVQKKTGVNLQVPPDLYKKMIWLTDNVPKMSHLKLARMGLEAEVERLLALHYRPET